MNILGCMEILYEELGLTMDRQKLVRLFGPQWNIHLILQFLENFGFRVIHNDPKPGDIVFVGTHPGVVREEGMVENIHHGRRVHVPLSRIKHKIDLVLSRCQQH